MLNSIAARIYVIPIVVVICFIVFLLTVTINGLASASLIRQLQKEDFPKLLLAEQRIVSLNSISESFMGAAITGESEDIDSAEKSHKELMELNSRVSELDKSSTRSLDAQNEKLEAYYSLAKNISLSI